MNKAGVRDTAIMRWWVRPVVFQLKTLIPERRAVPCPHDASVRGCACPACNYNGMKPSIRAALFEVACNVQPEDSSTVPSKLPQKIKSMVKMCQLKKSRGASMMMMKKMELPTKCDCECVVCSPRFNAWEQLIQELRTQVSKRSKGARLPVDSRACIELPVMVSAPVRRMTALPQRHPSGSDDAEEEETMMMFGGAPPSMMSGGPKRGNRGGGMFSAVDMMALLSRGG